MKLWIARDKNGSLWLYNSEPKKEGGIYHNNDGVGDSLFLSQNILPEVTFENSPQEVKLKLVSEIVGVAESPSKTFPRVNDFEVGASYRH